MPIPQSKPPRRVRLTRPKVAAAAIECFNRFGVHRTSMNDIADALGVSRQTVYRIFESRSELLEYIATDRVRVLTQKLTRFLADIPTFHDAIIEGMAYSVRLGRADSLLFEIMRQEGDAHFRIYSFGGTPEVQNAMLDAFRMHIGRARDAGTLSPDVSDQQIAEWLCNIGSVLNIREDYDEADHLRILRQFVAPSLNHQC